MNGFTLPESLMNDDNALEFFTSPDFDYEIDPYGLIESPGKFEREPWYTPYFWDQVMNGFQDDTYSDYFTTYDIFCIRRPEIVMFSLDYSTRYLAISCNDQGFVSCQELTSAEYNDVIDMCAKSESEEDY